MVNFNKIHNDWWDTLSKDRQNEILRIRALEKEHIYYETSTMLDDDFGGTKKERKREVQLYRPVINGQLGKNILLSFGGYCEYSFDKRFCLKLLHDFKQNRDTRFCIDAGNALYVKNTEMVRMVKEAIEALVTRNIELVDDYYANLTNSEMGKMLNEMGLR